jgi:hypothetical protein
MEDFWTGEMDCMKLQANIKLLQHLKKSSMTETLQMLQTVYDE